MTAVEGVGVQVDWVDWEIGSILKAEDHHRLAQNAILDKEADGGHPEVARRVGGRAQVVGWGDVGTGDGSCLLVGIYYTIFSIAWVLIDKKGILDLKVADIGFRSLISLSS